MKLEVLNLSDKKLAQLKRAGLYEIEDVLDRFPRKYIDARKCVPFSEIKNHDICRTEGRIKQALSTRTGMNIILTDNDGDRLFISFFGDCYFQSELINGKKMTVVGKFKREDGYFGKNALSISNPTRFTFGEDSSLARIIPIYKKIPGMSDVYYESIVTQCVQSWIAYDFLDGDSLLEEDLCQTDVAYQYIHMPRSMEDVEQAEKRLVFNDLYTFNVLLQQKIDESVVVSDCVFPSCKLMSRYYHSLPFDLTDGQKQVVRRLYHEGRNGQRISALLQADVGYGKTECAKMLALFTVEAGWQAVIVAPTLVLAKQHYEDFTHSFQNLPVKICYLAADITAKQRKKIVEKIESGEIQIIIGTHACFAESVHYKKLGTVIIDEEHRFGVKQRETLLDRTEHGIHTLSMSATPIPRTLALALYGEGTEVMDIKTAPSFKKEVPTQIVESAGKAIPLLLKELRAGHQAYVICPMVGDDEDDSDAKLAKDGEIAKEFAKKLAPYGFEVANLNGQMKKKEITSTIQNFVDNKIQVLVATTVVEVGVNVPNATVMMVLNSERFGLAQLHQLRGRVGRGKDQGYCLLQTRNSDAKGRLSVLVRSNDGFYISEQDLKLRGAGSLTGEIQKGQNFMLDQVIAHPDYNRHVHEMVEKQCMDEPVRKYLKNTFEICVGYL